MFLKLVFLIKNMKIQNHNRIIELPKFYEGTYHLIICKGTIWGFRDSDTAIRANRAIAEDLIKEIPEKPAKTYRARKRYTFGRIYSRDIGTENRLSLPKSLLERAALNIGDDIKITGSPDVFFIKKNPKSR